MKRFAIPLAAGVAVAAMGTAAVFAQNAPFRIDTQINDALAAAVAAQPPNPGAGPPPAGGAPPAANAFDEPGAYLTVGDRAVYMFEADDDDPTTVTCYGECAVDWPPVLVTNGVMPEIGFEAAAALIGTVNRTDGTAQLTYNGWPLYFFETDNDPTDINGQHLLDFGANWFLIDPDGDPIEVDPDTAPTGPPTPPPPAPAGGGNPPPPAP